MAAFVLDMIINSAASHWVSDLTFVFDVSSDAALVLLCAGLIGPKGDRAAELAEVSRLAVAHRERQIRERLSAAAQASTGPAVMLAALFEGMASEILIVQAVTRFRCILWDVLSVMPDIIVGGGTLDGQQASTSLYNLSQPSRVGECDVFFSHSWHDDRHGKWTELCAWAGEFTRRLKRSPRLWLDKVCVDQKKHPGRFAVFIHIPSRLQSSFDH